MNMIHEFFQKRIIPMIVSACLLIPSLSVGVIALSNIGGDSLAAVGFSESFITSEKNIIYGNTLEKNVSPETMSAGHYTFLNGVIGEDGSEVSSVPTSYIIAERNLNALTDGNLSHCDTKLNAVNNTFLDDANNPVEDMFMDVVFKLDSRYSDLNMLIIDSSSPSMRVTDYSVYASETATDLFSSEPIIVHCANTKQYNSVKIEKDRIQYVALRIYGVCTSAFTHGSASAYLRLMEVGISGTTDFVRTESGTLEGVGLTEAKLQSSDNALYGFTYQSGASADVLNAGNFSISKGSVSPDGIETSTVITTGLVVENMNKLTNGITDTGSGKNSNCNAVTFWENGVKKTDVYAEFVFNLGAVYLLEDLLIADAASTSATPASEHYMTDYSVFISNDAADVFVGSPVISHASNSQRFNLFDLSGKEAQYIGIRVYSACTSAFSGINPGSSSYLRTTEIALMAAPKGITAKALIEGVADNNGVTATVSRDNLRPGETVTFTTESDSSDYVFKGWKNSSGEFFCYDKSFDIVAQEGDSVITYTAVYEIHKKILLTEDFEGTTVANGVSGLSIGTTGSFYIKDRKGSETNRVLKYEKSSTDEYSYVRFYNNGNRLFKDYELEENTAYKLSLWYYIDSVATSTKPLFFTIPHASYKIHPETESPSFIYRDGPHKVYGANTGEWIEMEHYFYTYDIPKLTEFLIYVPGARCTTGVVYFDDIKLEKVAVVNMTFDKKEVETDLATNQNYVGGVYEYKYGTKEAAEIGEYTIKPKEGYTISSVILNEAVLAPEPDGSYKISLSADSEIAVESKPLSDWAKITVDQKSGTGKFVGLNTGYAAKLGENYSFKFITGEKANPVVTVNGEALIPENGIYTIPNVLKDATVKIVCDGDEYRGNGGKDAKGNDLTKYVKEIYEIPLWEGNVMYHETVTIYKGRTTARLLYPIDSVISVRSFDLKTEYVWGVDYDVNEKGELVILEGSSFPRYFLDLSQPSTSALTDGGHLQAYGIDVTFTHSKVWEDGYKKQPVESGIAKLPKLLNKLQNRENVEMVFYGASSTVGWSSSGLDEYVVWDNGDGTSYEMWDSVMIAPYVPTWPRQTHSFLKSEWGYDAEDCETDITIYNRSCAGRSAAHAANDVTLSSQFSGTNPDVVFLGFSGNDTGNANYIENLKKIITYVRTNVNPECEFIVASSSLPIYSVTRKASLEKIPLLEQLCKDYEGQGVLYAPTLAFPNDAFAGMTGCDYHANNFNHYNDFGVRSFTSVMVGLLSATTESECSHISEPIKGTPATCTESGLTDGVKCYLCGDILLAQEIIPAIGHKETIVEGYPATCAKEGLTDGVECSECYAVIIAQRAIAKKAHSYRTVITMATLKKNGKIVESCAVCGDAAETTTIYYAKTVKLSKTKFTYTGKTIKPTLVIKNSKGKTISSKYYTVSGTRSTKKIGKFKISLEFKDRYSGTKALYYTINPKMVASLKLKAGKKQMTVSYKKDSSVSGYEIVYATNSKFTKGKNTIKTASAKKTIKKLKSKRTYYVKVRAYKTVNGKKYYGKYTSAKRLKIK